MKVAKLYLQLLYIVIKHYLTKLWKQFENRSKGEKTHTDTEKEKNDGRKKSKHKNFKCIEISFFHYKI